MAGKVVQHFWPPGTSRRGVSGLQFFCDEQPNSLGLVNREMARACHRIGYDVGIELVELLDTPSWARTSIRHLVRMVEQPAVHVQIGHLALSPMWEGCRRVGFETYDGWNWSQPSKLEFYKDFGLVYSSSARGADAFRNAGIACPVEHVPLGVNGAIYKPWPRDFRLLSQSCRWFGTEPNEDTFFFLVAGYLQPRKGLEVAMEAFREAFHPKDNVALIVKTVPKNWGEPVERLISHMPKGHTVGTCETGMDEWEFSRLLASVDCYVSPHHQEGFGMLPLQAMGCGTLVVAGNWAGPKQYLTEKNAILVEPTVIGPPPTTAKGIPATTEWAYYSVNDLALALRRAVCRSHKRLISCGHATANSYSWENAARALTTQIEKHVAPLRRRPGARLWRVPEGKKPVLRLMIVAPARNSVDQVEQWASSARQSLWSEGPENVSLVLLWDGSEVTDELRAICKQHGVSLQPTASWLGEWGQRARCADLKAHGFLFLTDVDVEFTDYRWAFKCLETMKNHNASVVHPVLLNSRGLIWSAGAKYGQTGLPGSLLLNTGPYPAEGLPDEEIVNAPGAGWFLRLDTARKWFGDWPGGYFPTWWADTDMAMWLRSHGMSFWRCGAATVTHHQGSYTRDQMGSDGRRVFDQNETEARWWWSGFCANDHRVQELRESSEDEWARRVWSDELKVIRQGTAANARAAKAAKRASA
jgi:glycosyltransferase involved in cell wall biosynthesis